MSKTKNYSRIIQAAERRLAQLIAIDPNLDLGEGRTVAAFRMKLDKVRARSKSCHDMAAQLSKEREVLNMEEDAMTRMSADYRLAALLRYGAKSPQFAQLTGVVQPRQRRTPAPKPSTGTSHDTNTSASGDGATATS